MKSIAISLVLVGFTLVNASAQDTELDRSRLNTAAYYNYSDPGDITIIVHVWGAMRYPGLYEIPRETKVSELISLAGGPQVPARSRRSVRRVDLNLYRFNNDLPENIFRIEMENEIVISSDNPPLSDGDILSAESVVRQTFGIRDLFPIISATATMVLLVDRLVSE